MTKRIQAAQTDFVVVRSHYYCLCRGSIARQNFWRFISHRRALRLLTRPDMSWGPDPLWESPNGRYALFVLSGAALKASGARYLMVCTRPWLWAGPVVTLRSFRLFLAWPP